MPIREFGCYEHRLRKEVIHPSTDPAQVPAPNCPSCGKDMEILISIPVLDTSSTFNRSGGGPFVYKGPTGLEHEINTLHQLREVERSYQESGHDVRFDAWSANPSNPDPIDGFGGEYTPDGKTGTGKVWVNI